MNRPFLNAFLLLSLVLPAILGACRGPAGSSSSNAALSLQEQERSRLYWKYRRRLDEHFTVIASETQATMLGYNLPATEIIGQDLIKWGDTTTFLGWYLAMLAMEIHLLKAGTLTISSSDYPGHTLARSREQLQFAVMALQRLDTGAAASFAGQTLIGRDQISYPCDGTTNQDGFFIRDDVPADFGTTGDFIKKKNFGGSDYCAGKCSTGDLLLGDPASKEKSQDQVYHLLMGLAFVVQFASDEDITIASQSLKTVAQSLALNMVSSMKGTDGWFIRNPSCTSGSTAKLVNRGPAASQFSLGAVRALDRILDAPSGIVAANGEVWQLASLLQGIGFVLADADTNIADSMHMVMVLAATGNAYGDSTMNVLVSHAGVFDWYAYPMIHFVLYGATPGWREHRAMIREKSLEMLILAPGGETDNCSGDGICDLNIESGPSTWSIYPGWRSSHRFLKDKVKQDTFDDNPIQHNGLDYLVLHNLYLLSFPEEAFLDLR